MNHWGCTWAPFKEGRNWARALGRCASNQYQSRLQSTDPGAVVVSERGRAPRSDGPNYWPVNPRDLPLPAGWARGHGRSRECSPGTMSPKRAVGSISICLLCSVDSFCSLSMHVQVWSAPFGDFYSLLLCATTTPSTRSQHMLKPPRIGDDRARPYLAQSMLNFLHLGKSRFLLMIVLSLTHHRGPRPPQIPQPALQTQSQ